MSKTKQVLHNMLTECQLFNLMHAAYKFNNSYNCLSYKII